MRRVNVNLILIIVFLVLLIIRPDYKFNVLNTGLYYTKYENYNELKNQGENIVYYNEDVHGSVIVADTIPENESILPIELKMVASNYEELAEEFLPYGKRRILRINGRTQCGSDKVDLTTTTLLSAIPLALHNKPENALNIGLGCGLTYGALRLYDLKEIDNIELSRSVAEAASYFEFVNNAKLDDDISNLYIEDIITFMYKNDKKYDIIVTEPPPPWMVESSRTFSKEFLEQLRDHLNDDGLVSQWVLANEMILRDGSIEPFKIFYKTFDEVFPYNLGFISKTKYPINSRIVGSRIVIDEYRTLNAEMILIGSKKPIMFDKNIKVNDKMQERFDKIGITDLNDYYIFASEDMEGYVDEDVPVNTNDNSVLEFLVAGNGYYTTDSAVIVDDILKFKSSK